jgi:hypothetical protein
MELGGHPKPPAWWRDNHQDRLTRLVHAGVLANDPAKYGDDGRSFGGAQLVPGLPLVALDHLIEQHQRHRRGTWGNLGEGSFNLIHGSPPTARSQLGATRSGFPRNSVPRLPPVGSNRADMSSLRPVFTIGDVQAFIDTHRGK